MDPKNFLNLTDELISWSKKGLGSVSPNPCVGCFIINSDMQTIAQGYHVECGSDHAEVHALKQLKNPEKDLKDAYVFVSLEPCAHEGRTPSCAKTLAKYPIKGIVVLTKDPNPLVAGEGFKILENSGISTLCLQDLVLDPTYTHKVNNFVSKNPAWEFLKNFETKRFLKSKLKKRIQKNQDLNRHFFYAIQNSKPYISLKWAQSLNGVMASLKKRLRISGKSAQKQTHFLRATHDLTLVGANTVLADNPKLDVRFGDIKKTNRIAILDEDLKSLVKLKDLEIFKIHKPEDIFIITSYENKNLEAIQNKKFNFIFVELDKAGLLDLKKAIQDLYTNHKIQSILVEGGGKTLKSFYDQSIFNEIHVYIAPKFLKGQKVNIDLKELKASKFLRILGRDIYKIYFKTSTHLK